ncbi:capsular polysaccharide transport system permease protein [Roseivivax marinus]|uniref:ABC transporter permease n=1 Tax=Roseivivax marinus TaxID=1379903 RepID=UPI0008CCDD6C|nr:ABC transporter permease [Roseivivax marinus]SEL72163.1 capsular polysaccharide transport system permease protein [Roseivivax marinus]
MTDASLPPLPQTPARPPRRRFATARVVAALMLREMSTTYGRSAMGYIWAILEPVAGILLLTAIFSLGFRSPPIGTNFAIFFASGILPFMAFKDIDAKVTQSQRFSRQLLEYPGVTFLDTIIARVLLNTLTQALILFVVLTGIIQLYDLDMILDVPKIATAFVLAIFLAIGIGTLNSYFVTLYPVWERIWAILTRPLMLISCVIFIYDAVPMPYRDWLWWNPIVHVVGRSRDGVFSTYDASYVSDLYVLTVALVSTAVGLILLRRYHREMTNI